MNSDILNTEDGVPFRVKRKSDKLGDIKLIPTLPNDELMAKILNNKEILKNANQELLMRKVIDMEWKWLERHIIKWCGDTPNARDVQNELRAHIKKEKKWIKRGAKYNEL